MRIVGIDPGVSPTLCFFDSDTWKVRFEEWYAGTYKIAGRDRTRVAPNIIRLDLLEFKPDLVVIEDVWVMPKQGLSSSAAFIGSAWMVEGVCYGLGLRVEKVRPQAWKKYFKIGKGKDESRLKAIEKHPHLTPFLRRKMDHNRADALWLALYGADNASS